MSYYLDRTKVEVLFVVQHRSEIDGDGLLHSVEDYEHYTYDEAYKTFRSLIKKLPNDWFEIVKIPVKDINKSSLYDCLNWYEPE